MNTIIVPLDSSALAQQALPYARALAERTGAPLCLLQAVPAQHVASVYTPLLAEAYAYGDDLVDVREADYTRVLETLQTQAAMYLAEQAQALRTDAVRVASEVHVGDPAEVIVDVAAHTPGAWIVMATHGYSGLKRWTLGSVADKVLHAASVPVLVVRSQDAPPATVGMRHILVPLDSSALAQQALPLATALAHATHGMLTLVRAVAPPVDVWSGTSLMGLTPIALTDVYRALHAQAQQDLDALADDLRAQDLHVTTLIESAAAADAIIAAAQSCNADLVIMATHGRTGIQRWALGSVADKVLHAIPTPLLLVRAQPPSNS